MHSKALATAKERIAACQAESRDFHGKRTWWEWTALGLQHMEARANVDDVIARYRGGCSMNQAELEASPLGGRGHQGNANNLRL